MSLLRCAGFRSCLTAFFLSACWASGCQLGYELHWHVAISKIPMFC